MFVPNNLDTLYSLFLTIQQSDIAINTKRQMVACLLGDGSGERGWRVIGITTDAIQKMSENGFNYTKGIQRCHKHQRQEMLDTMLSTLYTDSFSWWSDYYTNDTTVLGTSTENMSDNWSEVHYFTTDTTYTGYFPSKRIGYRHNKTDTQFLTEFVEQLV